MKQTIIATVLALFSVTGLHAQNKIDFTQVLVGIDNKPLVSPDPKITTGMTLGEAAVTALMTTLDEDKGANGETKFNLYELARKISQNKNASLTVEEINTIKTRIGKAYGPTVVGPAWALLGKATGTTPVSK